MRRERESGGKRGGERSGLGWTDRGGRRWVGEEKGKEEGGGKEEAGAGASEAGEGRAGEGGHVGG